jgi:hypothetical protein
MKETWGKNNLTFVKEVPMRYVHLMAIVVSVSDKNKKQYFRTDLRVLLGRFKKLHVTHTELPKRFSK